MSNDQKMTTENTVMLTGKWVRNTLSELDEEELYVGNIRIGSIQRSGHERSTWLYYRKNDPGARQAGSREEAKDALIKSIETAKLILDRL